MNSMGRCVNECGRGRRRAYGVEEHAAKREGTQLLDYGWVTEPSTQHTQKRGAHATTRRAEQGEGVVHEGVRAHVRHACVHTRDTHTRTHAYMDGWPHARTYMALHGLLTWPYVLTGMDGHTHARTYA